MTQLPQPVHAEPGPAWRLLAALTGLNVLAYVDRQLIVTLAPLLMEDLGLTRLSRQMAYTLSGGEKRRTEIARALVNNPKFILLDEPFAGVDPLAVIDIKKIIAHLKSRNIGILISDHNVRETLEACDTAFILSDGKVIEAGTPEKIAESTIAVFVIDFEPDVGRVRPDGRDLVAAPQLDRFALGLQFAHPLHQVGFHRNDRARRLIDDAGQVDRALPEVIQQAPRRRHQDVYAIPERSLLGTVSDPRTRLARSGARPWRAGSTLA